MNGGSHQTVPAAAAPRTRAERRRREHTDRVLEAATRLFAERGFTETSMAAIADAADVAVGTLYNLFDSKEGLYHELVRSKAELFRRRLIAALRDATTRETAFDRFVDELHELFRREAASIRLYYRVSAQARISFRASLTGALRDRLEDTVTAFARVIDHNDPEGEDPPSPAAARAANVCQAMLNELFMLHIDDPRAHPADVVLAEARRLLRSAVASVPAPGPKPGPEGGRRMRRAPAVARSKR